MATKVPWLRIFVEGVVIIGSILLAFGIDAWWEGVQDDEAERDALELIHADLVADTVDLAAVERTSQRHLGAATWLLENWDDSAPDFDAVAMAFADFLVWAVIQPQRAAYTSTSLKDANRLGLVGNDELRALIVSYFEESQVYLIQRLDRAFSEREALLDAVSHHIRWLGTERDAEGRLSMAVRVLTPWRELQQDTHLAFQLAAVRAGASSSLSAAQATRTANVALRGMIEAELEARW